MVTLLITSFLLLAGITYVIYLWQRPSSRRGAEVSLPPPRYTGLFAEDLNDSPAPRELSDGQIIGEEQRRALLARAAAGEREALNEARASGDDALYDEVLNALVERAESDKSLLALASYITRSDAHLRVNTSLAERLIESWQNAPDRNTTARMLHVAALSNNARLYQGAIEMAYEFWRDRRLAGISPDELRQLIESEFWLLSPDARNSGAGFVLKHTLAQLRRKLATPETDGRNQKERAPP